MYYIFKYRLLFENRPALYFCNHTENEITIPVCWIPYLLMILWTLWKNIFFIRIMIGNARN